MTMLENLTTGIKQLQPTQTPPTAVEISYKWQD
jgi:hypothetical protein